MQEFADELTTTGDKIWSKLNLLFGAMIAIVVGVTILFQTLPITDEKDAQDKHIAKLDAALDNAEMTKNRLTREVEALKLDPEYAGMIARDRLNLMREGETILRIDPVAPKK